MDDSDDYTIVGGGIHGTYVATELLDAGVNPDDITIIDYQDDLLDAFQEKAENVGMDYMRSPADHNLGGSDNDLALYADIMGREDEITDDGRPTYDLFMDHAEDIVDRYDLDELYEQAAVDGIEEDGDGALTVRTDAGEYDTDNVVLAVGNGNDTHWPDWTAYLQDEDAPVTHVFDEEFTPDDYDPEKETYVIGGGSSAGQVADYLGEDGYDVTLLSRDDIEPEQLEADEAWTDWDYIADELHGDHAGSEARYDAVQDARNDGTMPPYVLEALDANPNVSRGVNEVVNVSYDGDTVDLYLADGTVREDVQIVLATGFEDGYTSDLMDTVADELGLDQGYLDAPVLDDDTLAWQYGDGELSDIYVTGELAELAVGPYARNIKGAELAADRIVDDYFADTAVADTVTADYPTTEDPVTA